MHTTIGLWTWALSSAHAAPGDLVVQRARGEPSCAPLAAAVQPLVEGDRLEGRRVFVEEISVCTPGRPSGVPVVLAPAELRGREALQAVVDTHAAQVAPVARYEVVERAGGWLVAPVGVDRLFDFPVSVDATRQESPRQDTLMTARMAMSSPIALQRKIWLAPLDGPVGRFSPSEPVTVSFRDLPLAEALVALYAPLEAAPSSFVLVHHPGVVDALGRAQAGLTLLTPVDPSADDGSVPTSQ